MSESDNIRRALVAMWNAALTLTDELAILDGGVSYKVLGEALGKGIDELNEKVAKIEMPA